MPTFTPPTSNTVPPVLPGQSGPAARLFRHYSARPAGRNVYLKTDGTVTEDQPAHADIAKVWFGGHIEPITEAEKTTLIAAGYAAHITG